MSENLLSIKDLVVEYTTEGDIVQAVNGVDLTLRHGESLGLVGETGAGKTTTALAILGLLPDRTARIPAGSIEFDGQDVLSLRDRSGNPLSKEDYLAAHTPEGTDPADVKLPAPKYMAEKKMRAIRGNRISMIFQDPMTSLNPVHSVGDQIAEVVYLHGDHTRQEAKEQACKMLEMVGIPADRYHEYPHQFSGGMKQRVVIAMSIACSPQLILADEPTTALDVTIQAQVLELMNELKQEIKTSVLLITHDLGVVAQVCDRVAIMYCGQIVEQGTIEEVFTHPAHPYTIGLFGSIPTLDSKSDHLTPIEGMVADPTDLPEGCYFAPRCPYACDLCRTQGPASANMGGTHEVRCFAAQGAFPCETLKEVIRIGRE